MDIVAHSLWAGIGVALLRRHRPVAAGTAAATVALAALPDAVQLLPILAWWALGDGSWAALQAYAVALPGQEPALPAMVQMLSHHLHGSLPLWQNHSQLMLRLFPYQYPFDYNKISGLLLSWK